MPEKLENYVIFQRKISADYRNRIITLDEFSVYVWLRLNANPYGISVTSLSSLSDDLFRAQKSENYMNKVLLSLKKKRFIYYKKRAGCRGSFEVRLGDFLLPTKGVTSLDKFFEAENGRDVDVPEGSLKSELVQSFDAPSQNLNTIKSDIKALVSSFSIDGNGRGSNNDTDTNKNNNKNRTAVVSFKKEDIYTKSFKPTSFEEQECLNIGITLGEKKMNYILSIYHRYGFHIIEEAVGIYNDRITTTIDNKPAFFNSIVQDILGRAGLEVSENLY
ncbi:MAG: hypothetical protein WBC83_02920 [Minisyncoccia bacterium]